jgi:hypothetical protein
MSIVYSYDQDIKQLIIDIIVNGERKIDILE